VEKSIAGNRQFFSRQAGIFYKPVAPLLVIATQLRVEYSKGIPFLLYL